VARTAPFSRIVGKETPLVRVFDQHVDGETELIAGGVGAAHDHRFDHHHEFLGRQLVARFFGRDEVGQQIVAWLAAAICDEAARVGVEFVLRGHDGRHVDLEVVVEDAQHVGCPTTEQFPIGLRGAEQFTDDGDRVRLADVGCHVAGSRRCDPVDEAVYDIAHGRTQRVGGENAGATSRRRRTWVSPSADRIDSRRRILNSGVASADISTTSGTALCQRLSRSTATTSSYRSTE
jgi:hypothetical protein